MSDLGKTQLATLTRVDASAGWRHLIAHFALIIGFASLTLGLSWIFLVPFGACLGALFPLMHEATHRHVLASPRGNARLAFICGAILLLPATWFRHFHQAHHRFTQDLERDPELASPRPATRAAYLWHLTGLPAWRASFQLLARQAGGNTTDSFVPDRAHHQIVQEARLILGLHALVIAAIILINAQLILITYVSLLIGQIFLRFFLLAEHGGLPFVDQVMENTRTTRAAAWRRWLTWNMSFHVEHHANPAVPHDKLPKFHKILEPETCSSYGHFHKAYWGRVSSDEAQRTD